MEYRQLGETGLRVSVVGFGASPLGDVFRKTTPEERNGAVHLAVDRGINFFDVSPYYGITLAEERLGEALAGRRDKVVLATKCGRYGGAEFDFSAGTITAGFEESLKRLRTDYVDLLQAHDVEFGHVEQIVEETLPAMRRLQEQGKARYIGITGYSLKNLMEIAGQGEGRFDSELLQVQPADYGYGAGAGSVCEGTRDWGDQCFAAAYGDHYGAGGSGVASCSGGGAGCGAEGGGGVQGAGVDASEVALKFCVDYAGAASTLVGLSSREHVERNLKAMELEVDAELWREIAEAVGGEKDVTWASGLEENWG